jgi:hypothetical protein
MKKKPAIAALFVVSAIVSAQGGHALPQGSSMALVPHRAVYDMSLKDALAASNISNIRGRLVFDFAGSPCAGYTLKSRLVTEVVDREGNSTLTDLRSTTWEDSAGDRVRFEKSQYVGSQLSELVSGNAARGKEDGLKVEIKKPSKQELDLDGAALFPTQHSLAILKAARNGENVLQADIFDGSEQGDKLFKTTTFIGKPIVPVAGEGVVETTYDEKLKGVTAWPVAISYYEPPANPAQDDGLPVYELSFQLFANGVSKDLLIHYGTFMVNGKLAGIEYHEPESCPAAKKG